MSDEFPILAAALMPHPPIVLPQISSGDNEAVKTDQAMQETAEWLMREKPDTVVIVSPHAPMFSDFIYVYDQQPLSGDFSRFGAADLSFSVERDEALQEAFLTKLRQAGIEAGSLKKSILERYQMDDQLDHGVLVPLSYLKRQGHDFKLVALSSSFLDKEKIYAAGVALQEAARQTGRRIVFVASGDQSHKVNDQSPYGFDADGPLYDDQLHQALQEGDAQKILSIDPVVCERAAECGYRSVVMLMGAFSRQGFETRLTCYEAPYGIGYCVALLTPRMAADGSDPLAVWKEEKRDENEREKDQASPPVQIAWKTLQAYLQERRHLRANDFADFESIMPELFEKQAPVFVSLHKWGALRGCIGTTEATAPTVVEEIIHNAIHAAVKDPRFDPVEYHELADLTIHVDWLLPAEKVSDRSQLDPKKYGVIVRHKRRSALLLPDLEGVNSVQQQLEIVCSKAGIDPESSFEIERFQVKRYE